MCQKLPARERPDGGKKGKRSGERGRPAVMDSSDSGAPRRANERVG